MGQPRWDHPRWPPSQCVAVNAAVFWRALHFFHLASHSVGHFPPCCFPHRITQTSLCGSWPARCQTQELHCIVRTGLRSHLCLFYNILLAKASHRAISVSKQVRGEESLAKVCAGWTKWTYLTVGKIMYGSICLLPLKPLESKQRSLLLKLGLSVKKVSFPLREKGICHRHYRIINRDKSGEILHTQCFKTINEDRPRSSSPI